VEAPSAIFHDAQLRAVGWRDLVRVNDAKILYELLVPSAWSLDRGERWPYSCSTTLNREALI
jgi:hypothetical protein